MEKHAVFLVRKCLDGNALNTSNEYFEFNLHNKCTRNNFLLNVPRVKPKMAKTGFFSLGVKCYNSLLLEIQKYQLDFRDKVYNYFKNK